MDLPFPTSVEQALLLDRNAAQLLNALPVDLPAQFHSTLWLDSLAFNNVHSPITVLVNLYCSNGSETVSSLPHPLPVGTTLVIIHPDISIDSITPIISPLSPKSTYIWDPFPLKFNLSPVKSFYSLSVFSPSEDPIFSVASQSLNIHSLASSLHKSSNIDPNSIKLTLLGPKADDFISIYTQIHQNTISKLSDKQRAVIIGNNQIPNSNHLVVIDRAHFSLPLNLIDTSYLGVVSIFYKDFTKIKLSDGTATFNLFNRDDPILPILINEDFTEIPTILNSLAKSLQSQFSKKDNLKTIDEMKLFVGDLSSLDVKRNWLARHTNLITEIFEKLNPPLNTKLPPQLDHLFDGDETEFNSRLSIQSDIQNFNQNSTTFNFISNSNANSTTQSICKQIEEYCIKYKQFNSTLKLINLLNAKSKLQINQLTSILQLLTRNFPMGETLKNFNPSNELLPLPPIPETATHIVFLGPISPNELSIKCNHLYFTTLNC